MVPKHDNYATSAENARLLFLKEDPEKLIRKFRLKSDDAYLYLRFLDMGYRIERSSGYIQKTADNESYVDDNSFHTALSLYDYLIWSRDDRRLAGQWVSMQNLGHSFHTGLLEGSGGLYAAHARAFSGHQEALGEVCRRLGGQKMAVGDVGYILPAFDELPVYFQFWDGDDEFPPRALVLWDANTQQFIHYETTYYVLSMIFDRMDELFSAVSPRSTP